MRKIKKSEAVEMEEDELDQTVEVNEVFKGRGGGMMTRVGLRNVRLFLSGP